MKLCICKFEKGDLHLSSIFTFAEVSYLVSSIEEKNIQAIIMSGVTVFGLYRILNKGMAAGDKGFPQQWARSPHWVSWMV